MKILHTSDWHLGKYLNSFSRLDEQKEIMDEICEVAENENIDAVLIAGDLFDSYNPSNDAVELFYKTIKRLSNNGKRAVIAIAGNHDSPDRIEAPDPLARECGIIFIGYPGTEIKEFSLNSGLQVLKSDNGFVELKLPKSDFPLRLLMTPYANEYRLRTYLGKDKSEEELRNLLSQKWGETCEKYCDENGVNILVSHLYFKKKNTKGAEEPDDEKPILYIGGAQEIFSENIPENIQYTALGHLHKCQTVDDINCPIIYSGSPLAYSFSESDQDKYVVIVDAKPSEKVKFRNIKLEKGKRLLRDTFNNIEEAEKWLMENTNSLVEITIVSDTFLSANDRKRLNACHDGIVDIIPEIKNLDTLRNQNNNVIDLSKETDKLFIDYFKSKYQQEPNDRLLNLFKEIIAEDEKL